MAGDSLIISVLGRPAKYRTTHVRMLERYNAYGIIGLFSDESSRIPNVVGGKILERWESDIKKIVEEFGEGFIIDRHDLNLLSLASDSNNGGMRESESGKIEVVKLLRSILKYTDYRTKFWNFDLSSGRRMIAPLVFLAITYFREIQQNLKVGKLNWMKDIKFRFITKPVSPVYDQNDDSVNSSKKKSTIVREEIQSIMMFDLPFLSNNDVKILESWEKFDQQNELARHFETQGIKIRESDISKFKNGIMTKYGLLERANRRCLSKLGMEILELYRLIYSKSKKCVD